MTQGRESRQYRCMTVGDFVGDWSTFLGRGDPGKQCKMYAIEFSHGGVLHDVHVIE